MCTIIISLLDPIIRPDQVATNTETVYKAMCILSFINIVKTMESFFSKHYGEARSPNTPESSEGGGTLTESAYVVLHAAEIAYGYEREFSESDRPFDYPENS